MATIKGAEDYTIGIVKQSQAGTNPLIYKAKALFTQGLHFDLRYDILGGQCYVHSYPQHRF